MDFIDRHRQMHGLLMNTARHPRTISPVVIQIPDNRCCPWRMFVHDSNRICFISYVSVVLRDNMELVQRALAKTRQKSFPDAGISARSQPVRVSIPTVEISNDRNFTRVRSPHAKAGALLPIHRHSMCAKLLVDTVVAALVEQIEI